MPLKLQGADAMRKKLAQIAARMPDKVGAALYREGEAIMTTSKRDFVPVDLGNLRATGHVQLPERKGNQVSVRMAFGGPAAAYALSVHETPSEFDPPSWEGVDVQFSPAGRGPKYLERPMNEAISGMPKRIAERIGVEDLVK